MKWALHTHINLYMAMLSESMRIIIIIFPNSLAINLSAINFTYWYILSISFTWIILHRKLIFFYFTKSFILCIGLKNPFWLLIDSKLNVFVLRNLKNFFFRSTCSMIEKLRLIRNIKKTRKLERFLYVKRNEKWNCNKNCHKSFFSVIKSSKK